MEINDIRKVIERDYDHEIPDKPRTVAFASACRAYIKGVLKGTPYTLEDFKGNWRDASGWITDGKSYVYVSLDYSNGERGWLTDVFIRAAKDKHDHTGRNCFTHLSTLAQSVHSLFTKGWAR